MALVTCDECNGKVSTKAVSCPHCGAKIDAKLWRSREEGERQQAITAELDGLDKDRAALRRSSVGTVPARTKAFLVGSALGAVGTLSLARVMDRPPMDSLMLMLMGAIMLGILFAAAWPSLASARYRALVRADSQISRKQERLEDSRLTLPQVFWGHLVVGSFIAKLALVVLSMFVPEPKILWYAAAIVLAYRAWALIHTWKASGRFSGNFSWIVITRITVVLLFAVTLLEAFALSGQHSWLP